MKKALLATIVIVLFLLHQDGWFWRTPDPLLFGFLPIALSYHAFFSVMAAFVMWALVKYAWPSHLEIPGVVPEPRLPDRVASVDTIQTGGQRDKEDRD